MQYLILLSALLALVAAVIAQDAEPVLEEGDDVAPDHLSAGGPVSAFGSELDDFEEVPA